MNENATFSAHFRGTFILQPLTKVETPDPVAAQFRAFGIESVTYSHPSVFTVEEGKEFKNQIPGGHTKNLFLNDKKDQLWLVTALWKTTIDLKCLPKRLNAARLSFGSAELMQETLGVTPSSVTALALLNDHKKRVQPVLDARLLECDSVNCHPLKNDKTTNLSPQDLLKFMTGLGYNPVIIDFAKG